MEINFDELRDWSDGARRALDRERERMMEQMKMLDGLARATEVIGDIQAENERLQAEVDDLQRAAGAAGSGDRRPAPSAPTGDRRPATATAGGEEPAPGDGATDGGQDERTGIEVLHQTGRAAQISKA